MGWGYNPHTRTLSPSHPVGSELEELSEISSSEDMSLSHPVGLEPMKSISFFDLFVKMSPSHPVGSERVERLKKRIEEVVAIPPSGLGTAY